MSARPTLGIERRRPALGRYRQELNYWPPLVDLLTSTLMIFILVSFLQTVLDPDDVEAILTRSEQSRFLEHFRGALEGEIAAGTVEVERHLNFLQITFSDRVLFESAGCVLQPRGERLLERCARVLAQTTDTGFEQIQVEGHTDSLPLRKTARRREMCPSDPRDNWELSTARALSVVRYLSRETGLDPGLFSANGYGEHRAVASNGSEDGRARNRRIEIRLFFSVRSRPEATDAL